MNPTARMLIEQSVMVDSIEALNSERSLINRKWELLFHLPWLLWKLDLLSWKKWERIYYDEIHEKQTAEQDAWVRRRNAVEQQQRDRTSEPVLEYCTNG